MTSGDTLCAKPSPVQTQGYCYYYCSSPVGTMGPTVDWKTSIWENIAVCEVH